MQILPHIDYVVYNQTLDNLNLQAILINTQLIEGASTRISASLPGSLFSVLDWERVRPRSPYQWAVQCRNSKTRLSGYFDSVEVHVEVPGTACDILEKVGEIHGLIEKHRDAITRIDLAVDFETDIHPSEFATARSGKRFRSTSSIDTAQGYTSYVGAYGSDRFARVYRYNHPHPRAKYLRVEHVFRRRYCGPVIEAYLSEGLSAVLSACGATWQWEHPIWSKIALEGFLDPKMISWEREVKSSKTLKWLEKTCVPAILRLAEEGEIDDLEDWLYTNIIEPYISKLD